MSKRDFGQAMSDLAVRAARAEIERDEALRRAERAEKALQAFLTKDEETMLDTLHVMGIPARSIKEMYDVEDRFRQRNAA